MTVTVIPPYVTKYFWGDNIDELSLEKNQKYIIQTLLEIGDQQAIKWLLLTINRDGIKQLLSTIQLSKKSANFWNLYIS